MTAGDNVLLVTGGGRGIGAAIALEAARRGYAVCVNYAGNHARAEEVVGRIAAAGGRAIAAPADVAEDGAVAGMFQDCDRRLGRVTHLVNSAGISAPTGRIEDCDAAALNRLFAINVTGTIICAREAIRRMSTRHGGKGGAIVNLSSVAARLGGAGRTVPYAASKGAIDSLTWGLAQEVAAEGIRVNAVSPGVIATDIHPPGRLEAMAPQIPMQRVGTPEEVAATVLWLLSAEASYVTGARVDVSGAR